MMVFLELIRVQSTDIATLRTRQNLWAAILAEVENSPVNRYHIYFRQDEVHEALLTFRWEAEEMDAQGSTIARALMVELRKHGLVHHSLWKEGLDL